MKLLLILLFLTSTASAEVRELFIPNLDCGAQEFRDVTVTFDDTPGVRGDLTRGKICEKLALKLLRKDRTQEVSRFIADELAPKQLDRFMPRANDFFKLVLFKGNIITRERFDFTHETREEILRRLERKLRLRVKAFHPSSEQMATVAYHHAGTAYFNSQKLHRSACSQINTLVHEYMHYAGYSHGDNLPDGKENSVPYYFGNRAQELCEAGVI